MSSSIVERTGPWEGKETTKAGLGHCSSVYVCRKVGKVSEEAGFWGKKKQKMSLPWRTN